MSAPENTTYMTLLEELTPDLERADAAETPQDLLEAIQDAQDRTERFPVAHPERVEKWYIEGYRRDLHDWIRRSRLELLAVSYLLFGRRPDGPSVVKILDDLAMVDTVPGITTPLALAKFIEHAIMGGELAGEKDSDGKIVVEPGDAFRFVLAHGFEMESSLRVVWLEAIEESASAAKELAGEQLECDAVDADTASATVDGAREIHEEPAHPEENIRAEWGISENDGALVFRTFTEGVADGVAEFERKSKSQLAMTLLCERGHDGVSIPDILEAVYPKDFEKLKAVLRDAPRECTKDALLDYYKNAGVHKILKRAKQIIHTVRKKLNTNGIPGEVVEILPGLETSILEGPSAPVVFLRVEKLQKKRMSQFKIRPGIVNASGLSEHTKNASRPDPL